jgi:hypothetical protein
MHGQQNIKFLILNSVKIEAAVLQQVHEENLTARRRERRGTVYGWVCADYLYKELKK